MSDERLTAPQRRALEEELEIYEAYFEDISFAQLAFHQTKLGWIVHSLGRLGLATWCDRSYQDWKRLSEYVRSISFTRRFGAELSDWQTDAFVGYDRANLAFGGLPINLRTPVLTFVMYSQDFRRRLECRLYPNMNKSDANYLNQHRLVVSLNKGEGKTLGGGTKLVMHFMDWQRAHERPRSGCEVHNCINHRSVNRIAEVEQAYEIDGVLSVWHVLDRIWSDSFASRPLVRPLSPPALAVRCFVHRGRAVKVLTHSGPLVGLLTEDNRGTQSRDLIRLQPAAGSDPHLVQETRTIAADDILEILPWRLDD